MASNPESCGVKSAKPSTSPDLPLKSFLYDFLKALFGATRRERLNALRYVELARQEDERRQQLQERREEREHQHRLLETFFTKQLEASRVSQEGVLAIAQAVTAQAGVLSTWLKGFHIEDPSPALPQTVRPEDEWVAEQLRLHTNHDPSAFPVDLPPEFQLAWAINQTNADANNDFDREGSDF